MFDYVSACARLILTDVLGSFLWFPIWWYSIGFERLLMHIRQTLAFRRKEYGFAIWIRNFFVPMYGQHDWTGRLISIWMRFVVLVARLVMYAVEVGVYVIVVLAYLFILPASIIGFLWPLVRFV